MSQLFYVFSKDWGFLINKNDKPVDLSEVPSLHSCAMDEEEAAKCIKRWDSKCLSLAKIELKNVTSFSLGLEEIQELLDSYSR